MNLAAGQIQSKIQHLNEYRNQNASIKSSHWEVPMLNASVFVGISVDGFMARANDDLDWLPPGGGEEHGYEAFMASVDALVIGRRTFEKVMTFDTWPYGEKPVFVLSTRSLAPIPSGAVMERLSGAPTNILASIDARGVRH